jgi:hypothetical protein
MKIENRMKYSRVKEALVRWVLGTDGHNGANCSLYDMIPWGEKIESVIPWEDVCDEINEAFGCRTDENNKWWDAGVIFTNENEFKRFDKFITEKTNKVMTVYQGIIDKANLLCNTVFKITVHKFVSVENNVAQYEPICHYSGNRLTSLVIKVYDKLQVSNWTRNDFIDSVHYGLYCNSSVVFNSKSLNEHNLRLEVTKNC